MAIEDIRNFVPLLESLATAGQPSEHSARNIEIKARVQELSTIRAKLSTLASGSAEVIPQTDTFFTVPRGRLKVRAFSDGSGELISYDRDDLPGPRESAYTRVVVADAAAVSQALGRVLGIRGVVSKTRELYMIGRTRVHLDHVDGLGRFVELEVVLAAGESTEEGVLEANRLLEALDIPHSSLVAAAYVDLLAKR